MVRHFNFASGSAKKSAAAGAPDTRYTDSSTVVRGPGDDRLLQHALLLLLLLDPVPLPSENDERTWSDTP